MRVALLIATVFTAMLAIASYKSAPKPTARQLVERQVNQRIDRQLHATLQKLAFEAKTQTAALDLPAVDLLTAR